MNKPFENEVFESDDCAPELANGTAAYDAAEAEKYMREDPQGIDRETGEVLEEPVKPAVRLVNGQQAARSASSDAKGTRSDSRHEQSPKARVKRTEQQMIAALGGSALKKATYAAERISKLEDKITELMGAIGPEARQLILNDFPHLNRY